MGAGWSWCLLAFGGHAHFCHFFSVIYNAVFSDGAGTSPALRIDGQCWPRLAVRSSAVWLHSSLSAWRECRKGRQYFWECSLKNPSRYEAIKTNYKINYISAYFLVSEVQKTVKANSQRHKGFQYFLIIFRYQILIKKKKTSVFLFFLLLSKNIFHSLVVTILNECSRFNSFLLFLPLR